MSKVTGSKPSAPKKSGSPLLAGILMGMVVGVALAAGLAWFILKSPSPFVNKEATTRPAAEVATVEVVRPEPVKPKVEVAAVSGVDEAKPRFEFYKVLTDKPDAADAQLKPAEKPKAEESKAAKFLQAGSFSNATDAENLKATLAMKGMEASVQKVNIPGRGDMHRVRVGPFSSEQELSGARGTLKLNGLDATPVH